MTGTDASGFARAETELQLRVERHGSWFQRFQLAHKIDMLRRSGCLALLSPDGTALDLGCGTGITACLIALAFPLKDVIGIDTNEGRIRACRRLARGIPNVTFLSGDVQHLGLRASREIICFDVLHHLPDDAQDRLVLTVGANLEAGGRLIVFEVDTAPKHRWQYWISLLSDYLLYPFQEKAHFRSAASYHGLFQRAGLEVERTLRLPSRLVAPIVYVVRRGTGPPG